MEFSLCLLQFPDQDLMHRVPIWVQNRARMSFQMIYRQQISFRVRIEDIIAEAAFVCGLAISTISELPSFGNFQR